MNKKFYLYKVISLLIISVFFCNCSKVKNEPVKVIQTGSFSNALVIQVNKIGKYSVYIPNDTVRPKFAKLVSLKAVYFFTCSTFALIAFFVFECISYQEADAATILETAFVEYVI